MDASLKAKTSTLADAELSNSKEIKLKEEGEAKLSKVAGEKRVVVENLKQQTDVQRKEF